MVVVSIEDVSSADPRVLVLLLDSDWPAERDVWELDEPGLLEYDEICVGLEMLEVLP